MRRSEPERYALAAGAGPYRLLPTAGFDGNLVGLGPLGLRQRDAHDAVLKGGLGLGGVNLEGEGDCPLELPDHSSRRYQVAFCPCSLSPAVGTEPDSVNVLSV